MEGYILINIVTQKRIKNLNGTFSGFHHTAEHAMKQLRDDFDNSPFITIQKVR